MRAALLALFLAIAATAPTLAADQPRTIEDFYGAYLGHGGDDNDSDTPAVDKTTRFSQVIIRPAKEEKGGFTVEWATLRLKGDEIPTEADTKTYVKTFRPTDKPNVYRVIPGDGTGGTDTTWAVLKKDTLSIFEVSVGEQGYYLTQYDRKLTAKGLDVHFTRIENSKIVRTVKLSLLKGPAKVN